MGIFVRNFTQLLSDQIYTLSPSFIEIFLELTKLHSFNHDNPHFTVFVSMFIRISIQCSLKFEITSITKERLLATAGEVPQATAEAKDHRRAEGGPSDHLARAATGADRQGCGKLHQALDCLCGCQWWAL